MKRKEIVQQLFDEFEPFIFKKDERREISKETMDEFQPFLDKLNRTKKCKITLEIYDQNILNSYEINVMDGFKKFINNIIEFHNKCDEDSDAHATEGALEENSEEKMNLFFSSLFNKRLKAIFEEGDFYYRFEHMAYQNNECEIIFYDEDEESIIIELLEV